MSSEVARLRRQLELECEAMKRGLEGYAIMAQHKIIEKKYKSFAKTQEELEKLVGEEQAAQMAADMYIKVMG
jgi:hypothetical protein